MKLIAPILAMTLVMMSVFPASAQVQQEQNKRLVLDFYELAFGRHEPKLAAKKYLSGNYIQHDPRIADGAKAFSEYFEKYFNKNPESRYTIHRTLAEGNLVALHLHKRDRSRDQGQAAVDIFRIEDGKIVEHWGVIQEVPKTTASGNDMFKEGSQK